MNWTVDRLVLKVTQKNIDSVEDVCPHVHVGGSAHYVGEQDSFGPVSSWLCCDECYAEAEKAQAARDQVETEVCHDCKQEVPRKDILEWKWYDFYAPQGDEPLCICKSCWTKEKHVQRRAKDDADYNEEMDLYQSSPEDEEADGFYGWFVVVKGSFEPESGWAELVDVNNIQRKVSLWDYQGSASKADAMGLLTETAKKRPELKFEVVERK